MSAGLKKRLSKASASRHDSGALFGAVRASHRDVALAVLIAHVNAPWITAHFTVLDKAARYVRLDIHIDVLTAIWALDDELFVHGRWYADRDVGSGFGVRLRCMTPRLPMIPAAAVLAVFSLTTTAGAQAYLPEDNLAYPVQVLAQGGGGTGFFVRRDGDLYLVTARHVLVNPLTEQLWAREVTLRALSKDLKETAVTVIHLNTGQLQDERQIRTDAVRDVAVVRLGTLTSEGMNTTAGVVVTDRSKGGIIVAPFDYLTRYTDVDVSRQIFMLGYPSIGVTGAAQ